MHSAVLIVRFFSASDRAVNDSLADAKEGLVVSCVDAFETYKSYARYFISPLYCFLFIIMRFILRDDFMFT